MITITYDDRGLALRLQDSPRLTALTFQRWMTDVVTHLVGAVQQNIGQGGLIGRRTGTLARAIMSRVTATTAGPIGEVFPDLTKAPYGGIQEEGGVIIPSKAAALAIPLEAMLTGNGVARGTAAQVKANPGAFGFTSTFIPKGHNVIMGRVSGREGSAIPLFALKQSVVIPATHYLTTTLTQEITWIADRLEQIARDVVNVVFGEEAVA